MTMPQDGQGGDLCKASATGATEFDKNINKRLCDLCYRGAEKLLRIKGPPKQT
eukprot:gene3081-2452_t